ncbi:MAG: hydrolase [Dehalococcoidales bacterium]|nr:hydrolase [Dehalococcoidales bacterium]
MLKVEDTVVVVIDIQTKLWNVMYEKEALLENAHKLVKGMQVMGVPIIWTEQNPQGLGPTVPDLAQLVPGFQPIPKLYFSCCQEKEFQQTINGLKRKSVLVCGIEAHICVFQTSMELLGSGFEVQVVADVVSSRIERNRDITLSRLQSEGVKLTTSEMAIYELLKSAGSPQFKEMLRVVK